MSTRSRNKTCFWTVTRWPAREADNVTAIMWDTRRLANLQAPTACHSDSFNFLFGAKVRTSLRTHVWAFTACYGDSFTSLYVDYIRTWHETYVWAFTACYGDSFTFLYVDDVPTSRETRLWASKSLLQAYLYLKNGVFWVVTPCGSCKNRRFGGTWRLLNQGDKNLWTRNNTSCN
jgi:hypothetical protein